MANANLWTTCVVGCLVVLMAGGCSGSEVIDYDDQVPISTLLTFINASSDKFISQIGSVPEISNAPTQLVLELGTVVADPTQNPNDVEFAQEAVRGRFLDSTIVTNRFLIVQNIHRSVADAEKIGVTPIAGDPTSETDKYAPSSIYTLNGRFQKVGRSGQNLYQLQLSLIHWKTRKIVLNKTFQQVVARN